MSALLSLVLTDKGTVCCQRFDDSRHETKLCEVDVVLSDISTAFIGKHHILDVIMTTFEDKYEEEEKA